MENLFIFLDKIKHRWEKISGLILTITFLLFFYFSFIHKHIEVIYPTSNVLIRYLIIPLIVVFLIYIIWLISTRRLNWLKTNKITVGVFIKTDDEESVIKIKKLLKETISDINSNFNNITLRLYPINIVKSRKQLNKYYSKKSHILDAIIFSEVESGKRTINGNTDDIIEIVDVIFQGNFDVNKNLKLFKTSINISNDVKLRDINKNWAYIEGNSLEDKKKIKYNFNDTILFYCGLYLIYQNNFEDALTILKSLQNTNDSQFKIIENEKKLIANKNFISASRLNDILLNLFVINSSKSYINKRPKEAYDILKDCEKTFGLHPQSYGHFIQLARLSYELGDINEAKSYTAKAKKLKHYGTEIYLNEGFFGVIDKNENEIIRNYKELSKVYKHSKTSMNFTEIAHWLEQEKKNLTIEDGLIEFAIGTIHLFYSDKHLGRKILKNLINNNNEIQTIYPKISDLIKLFLNKGEIKSVYHHKYKSLGKKKKKKRKNRK